MQNNFPPKSTRFSILGAALSGIACAKLLNKLGFLAFVSDQKNILENFKNILDENKIPYEQNGHNIEKLIANTDIFIVSPGIPLNSEIILNAIENNIPVLNEIEVASWFFPKNIKCIGITGTNGKSTTTHYLNTLLNLKFNSIACGNIGKPVSEVIFELLSEPINNKVTFLCIELSSYQLESIYSPIFCCSSFLNIQNDHLARYENMNEYLKAKWRMLLLTQKNGLIIIDQYVLEMGLKLGLSLPNCKLIVIENKILTDNSEHENSSFPRLSSFRRKSESSDTNFNFLPKAIYKELNKFNYKFYLHNLNYNYVKANIINNSIDILINKFEKQIKWHIQNACLYGKHNMYNVLHASLIAEFLKLPVKILCQQWEKETSSFKQLPHRLEIISKENEIFLDSNQNQKCITIVNDSKATNVESTIVALMSSQKNTHLLLGGEPKGDDYALIFKQLKNNFPTIYPFGKASTAIVNQLSNYKQYLRQTSANLLEAANKALVESKSGDIILLSPACSSFDEFRNFEHRGDIFRNWALSCLKEK